MKSNPSVKYTYFFWQVLRTSKNSYLFL